MTMIVFATIVFVLSLVGVLVLFVMKQRELRLGIVYFPELRRRADVRALHVKELAIAARADISKVPPALVRFGRWGVREAALASAVLARRMERQAHRVADLVSHKRHYERRETRSEFLRKVAEHKLEHAADEHEITPLE